MSYNDTDYNLPDFDEASSSQIPAIIQLINIGYTYLSREGVRTMRESNSKYILKDIAFEAVRKINSSEVSDKSIRDAIFDLENINMSDGVYKASEDVFSKLISGVSVSEIIEGKNVSPQMRFIDFENPINNSFHVTCEFELEEGHSRRPDIVLFVNGIPFAVIENKKPSVDVSEAVTQMLKNQGKEQTPKFFLFPQILVACNVREIKYATMLTPFEFWALWKEKETNIEEYENAVSLSINTKVDQDVENQVSYDLTRFNKSFSGGRQITEQDKGIYSLLNPERLLELVHGFIIYDNHIKKIARYQQYFAIKKIIKRIESGDTSDKRDGGLVWHTQGSGKSLTMVMLVKSIIEQKSIELPRIIVVTDRKDLDKQIRDTFEACNIKKGVIQANSGRDLMKLIKEKDLRVLTTLIHKFESSKEFRDFVDEDRNIFILIDEAHRSQGGFANIELNKTLPKACQIAFTGTPLMKSEKSIISKFGGLIDAYTISEAEKDGAVLPLIYQARYVEQTVQQNILDKFYERATKDLTEEQRKDLEKKFTSSKIIEQTSQRIEFIAYDIINHFDEFVDTGLKAQVVAPSKYAAVMFKKAFDMAGFMSTEVIISDVSANDEEDDKLPEHKKIVAQFLEGEKHKHGSLDTREKSIIKDFKENPEGCKILIVVDKLLTGFDAPRNTFLYLAKELKEHNLLQAIARVNRLFNGDKGKEAKTNGIIIDYSKNAKNLKKALELFTHYDPEDIERALLDTDEKIRELEGIYQDIFSLFNSVKNKKDTQEYVDSISGNLEKRENFYEMVNSFIKTFSVCRALHDFPEKFDSKKMEQYILDMKGFIEIKKIVKSINAETVDFSKYEDQIRRILNKYVSAEDVSILSKPINLSDTQEFNQFIEDEEKGLSNRSKAEAIAAQTRKVIKENWEKDPDFYKKFGEKIRDLIAQLREAKHEDLWSLLGKAKEYQQKVKDYEDNDIPDRIKSDKDLHPYYRNLKHHQQKHNLSEDQLSEIVKMIHTIISNKKIVDWYRNVEIERKVRDEIEDYLFDEVKDNQGIPLSVVDIDNIVSESWNLAIKNRTNG
jgi:type I restriction enzyme, R subunit